MRSFEASFILGVVAVAAGRTAVAQTELSLLSLTNVWRYYQRRQRAARQLESPGLRR